MEPKVQSKHVRFSIALLACVVVVAPLLLGGATDLTELVIVVLGVLAATSLALSVRGTRQSLGSMPYAALAGIVGCVWTVIQALPLPCGLVDWLGAIPDSARTLRGLQALDSATCSLSAAPGATRAAASLAATLTALLLASTAAARLGYRSALIRSVAVSTVIMANVALMHGVFNAGSVFGLYVPEHADPQILLAPLMNENHLAGFCALGWPLCLSLCIQANRPDTRILWGVGALTVVMAGILSMSRGGVGALAAGGLGYLFYEGLRRRRGDTLHRGSALALAVVMTVAFAAMTFTSDLLARQFSSSPTPFEKLTLPFRLRALYAEHGWLGVGRGALGDVATALFERDRQVPQMENFIAQWAVEWGAPVTAIILGLLGASLARMRTNSRSERALAFGLFALGAQNLVDFSLELAGVASVAAVTMGVLVSRERSIPWLPQLNLRPALYGTAIAANVLLVGGCVWLGPLGRDALRTRLTALLRAPGPDFATALRRALNNYPNDPTLVLLGAARSVRLGEPQAGRWLSLSMSLAPGWGAPHFQAAYWLEGRGALKQAALELGLGLMRSPEQHKLACAFVKRHPSADSVWDIVPAGAAEEQLYAEGLTDCLVQDHHHLEAERSALRLVEAFPKSVYGHRKLVMYARSGPEALERARMMRELAPDTSATLAIWASAMTRADDARGALAAIDAAPDSKRFDLEVLQVRAAACVALRDPHCIEVTVRSLLERHSRDTASRSGMLAFASAQYAAIGNHVSAYAFAQQAYELSGDPVHLELSHREAVNAGLTSGALRTASELCNVGHGGGRYCKTAGAAPVVTEH